MAKDTHHSANFQLKPINKINDQATAISEGWAAIGATLKATTKAKNVRVIGIECYPGVALDQLIPALTQQLAPDLVINSEEATLDDETIAQKLTPYVTEDRVFGRYYPLPLADFYDPQALAQMRSTIVATEGLTLIFGHGVTLVCEPDLLILADMPRWEIEQRQRVGMANWHTQNATEDPLRKFKRGYFIEWRIADKHKATLLPRIDFLLDTVDNAKPKLLAGKDFRLALHHLARRPFQVVPCFDPGVWGGQWLRQICGLPEGPPNYAWCFNCIIEANSLLLGFGDRWVEIPAIDLVLYEPVALLGEPVFQRFGAEFPIRFNFLDTMQGGNLSLQVHPMADYLRNVFGFHYPQDESYYVMAAGEDASVYLGVKTGVTRDGMIPALEAAQQGDQDFAVDHYVNRWPANKHDHFLIPAGTVHCSGRNTVVLEISSTPYIFTFKLWDWGRLGLDGLPRPVHINHGAQAIQFERDTEWTQCQLINRFAPITSGKGWREERTGLHELEFIETRRHWFSVPVKHDTGGHSVQVVNLCEGEQALVTSPEDKFPPLKIHYAETFIVPAAVGAYNVCPAANATDKLATIKAFVRT
jgi:mannose-6-phosphate isomerase class I